MGFNLKMYICFKKHCPGCYVFKRKHEYHLCEWNKDKDRGNCKTCIERRTRNGAPLECNTCNEWFCEEAFEPHQRDYRSTHTRVCIGCLDKRVCIVCVVKRDIRKTLLEGNGNMHDTIMVEGNVEFVWNAQSLENGIVKAAVQTKIKYNFHNG